ncbi:hypothetical protein MHU86_15819 [Fragilaria crotonensis]|nr:hypothetical protein MHU86_15819 [Fragilaria crotonensis]
MNAAHISGYVGLSETYRYHNFFERLNTDFALLTERELQRMNDIDLEHGGCCHRELIVWCLHEIQSCHAEGILDNELAYEFREQILELRVAIGKMYSIGDFPIPFFFVHFICLLSALYLPLFAMSAAYKAGSGDDKHWIADVIGGLVVVLQSVYLNGLRILGQKMSDPYGSDLTDFSVIFFVTYSWVKSNRILESEISVPNENEEEKLKRKRVSIGKPWDRRVDDNPFV